MQFIKSVCVIIFLSVLVIACGSKQYAALPEKSTVLVLGDSLTYGTGADQHQDYPSLLAAQTRWNVINAGVPGNTSAQGLERLPDLLDEHKVDFLIVALGGNDFLRKLPESETEQNLKAILAAAKAKNIPTLLLAIPAFSPVGAAFGNLSDHALYAKLAKENDVPLIEELFTEVLAKNSLKSDYVHPNAEGYRVVGNQLLEELTELGFLAKK